MAHWSGAHGAQVALNFRAQWGAVVLPMMKAWISGGLAWTQSGLALIDMSVNQVGVDSEGPGKQDSEVLGRVKGGGQARKIRNME